MHGFNTRQPLGAYTARLNFGVALFFLLSGFLLYRPFVAARLEGGRGPSVRDYTRRRVLRIVPAYWVALTVLALTVPQYLRRVFSAHWWAYFALMQSWSGTRSWTASASTWSLSVEAAFYMLLPLFAYVRRGWRRRGATNRRGSS